MDPLVDKSNTNAALRVAPGVVNLATAYKDTRVPTSIPTPMNGGKAIYVGSLDEESVLQGCRLLLDGSKTFTTMIPLLLGGFGINAAKSVEVIFANTTACKTAIDTGNVDQVLGAVMLDGEQLFYVTCKETGCHAYQQVSDSSTSANMVGKRRRSLLNTAVYPLAAVNKRKILQTPSPTPASSPPAPAPEGDDPEVVTPDDVETSVEFGAATAALVGALGSGSNSSTPSSSDDEPAPDGPAPDEPVDPASPSDPSDSGNSGANEGPAPDAPVDPTENPDPSDSGNSAAPADSGNESAPAAPAGGGDEPVPEDEGGGAVDDDPEVYGCFPRMATVQLHDGTQKRMYQLVPGDHVLSIDNQGQVTYSPVYVLPDAMPNAIYNYRKFTMVAIDHQISDDSNATMATKVSFETTPDHYLLVATGSAHEKEYSLWSTRRAVRAAEVKIGDKMWMADKTKNAMKLAIILDIEDILDEGIFSPLTLTGTIVVDGVVASVYTDMLGSEYNMHVFCAWGRWCTKYGLNSSLECIN